MKTIILLFLFCNSLLSQSHTDSVWAKYNLYQPALNIKIPKAFIKDKYLDFNAYLNTDQIFLDGAGLSAMFIAGATRGLHETILNHYSYFKREYPNTNDQWWDPQISWKNKYTNYDVNQGRNKVPIFLTDAYHLTNAIEKYLTISGSMVLVIGEKHKPIWYFKKFLLGCISYQAGFTSTYSIKFHK